MPDNSTNETPTIATDVTGSSAHANGSSDTPTNHTPQTAAGFDSVVVERQREGVRITGFLDGRAYRSYMTPHEICLCTPLSITHEKGERSTRAPYMFGPSSQDGSVSLSANNQGNSPTSGNFKVYPLCLTKWRSPSKLLSRASEKIFVSDIAYRLNTESGEFKSLPHAIKSHALDFIRRMQEERNEVIS